MATFPAIPASVRALTPGAWAASQTAGLSGGISIVRRASAETGRAMPLRFEGITEAEFLQIVAHYRGQRSGFDPFDFTTTTVPADHTPAGHSWRYTSKPKVIDQYADCFTVDVDFGSEPRPTFRVGGAELFASASITGALAPLVIPGASLTASASIASSLAPLEMPFSAVSLLLNGQGTSGSTSIVDQSSNSLTITNYGNTAFSSAQSKFSGGSMAFNGSSQYLQLAGGSLLSFPGNYQVEIWFYQTARYEYSTVLEIGSVPGTVGNIMIRPSGSGQGIWAGGTRISTTTFALDAWHYVKVWRLNGVVSAAVNDSAVGTSFNDTSTHGAVAGDSMMIGNSVHAPGPANNFRMFAGYVGPLRIAKGFADNVITPPTDIFPTS
jgi:hypothetical protein